MSAYAWVLAAAPSLTAFGLAVVISWICARYMSARTGNKSLSALCSASIFLIIAYAIRAILDAVGAPFFPGLWLVMYQINLARLDIVLFAVDLVLRLLGVALVVFAAFWTKPSAVPATGILKLTPFIVIVALVVLYQPVVSLYKAVPYFLAHKQEIFSSLEQSKAEASSAPEIQVADTNTKATLGFVRFQFTEYARAKGAPATSFEELQSWYGETYGEAFPIPLASIRYIPAGNKYALCGYFGSIKEWKCSLAITPQ
jgi:hypothetical protein